MDGLTILQRPELRDPYIVAAFAGWPNAADVASRAIIHLRDRLGAARLARIEPEEFYDFSTLRPLTSIKQGKMEVLQFPGNEFFFWRNRQSEHDLILFLGTEPHLKWATYVDILMHVAQAWRASGLLALGGLYDRVPHTREPRISAVFAHARFEELLRKNSVALVEYTGPAAIHSQLLAACVNKGFPALSLWGHAPSYAQVSWNPAVTMAMLSKLAPLLEVDTGFEELRAAADYLSQALDRLVEQDAELRQYLRQLEAESEGGEEVTGEPPSPSDAMIREIEEFLRGQQDQDEI